MDDLVIIGGGPAGMTAAVYSVRKNLATTIVSDNIGGQALYSTAVENYLGYKYITGEELVQKFEEHIESFKIKQEFAKVKAVIRDGDTFIIETDHNKQLQTRAVVVASGKIPRRLGVPGEKEYAGHGVAYCATCDGPMFAGMDVAVVGGGNSGFTAAIQLANIAMKVYIIEHCARPLADEVYQESIAKAGNAEVRVNSAINEITGEKLVKAIVLADLKSGAETIIPVGGVFVEIGWEPTVDFLNGQLTLNKLKEIIVDSSCRTNIPGIFAAGDVTDVPEKQIIVAAGEGAKAALSAYNYLIRGK
jgi:NADH-dependent peroxiredoxin subunit F